MSFIDKAKQKLMGVPKGLGEETVRIVDYDEMSDEELKSAKASKKKPAPKSKPAPKPKSAPAPKVSKSPEPVRDSSSDDTAFEIEDKSLFSGKPKKKLTAVDKLADDLIPTSSDKIKDVLEVLNIPDTFEIENSIFMPDDLDEVNFDQQAPVGYDIGQVSAFVEQCRKSLTHYVGLLKLRNEHVAKLATVVDRLQVDLNNAIFDREVANGINIMPTQDDEDLERKNFELQLLVRRLTDQVEDLKNGDELSSSERVLFETLQDELSLAKREIEDMSQKNYDLKNQVAYLQENGSDEDEDEDDLTDHAFNYESADEDEDSGSFGFDPLPDADENALPLVDDDELLELPAIDDFAPADPNRFAPKVHANSAFFGGDDQPLEEFLAENRTHYEDTESNSMIEIMDDDDNSAVPNARAIGILNYEDDDDEDDLDQIMKAEWGNK